MRVIVGEGRRGPVAASLVVFVSVSALAFTIASGQAPRPLVIGCAGAIGAIAFAPVVKRWHNLLALLVLCVLFIPIRRYTMGGVGFQLEPYRLLVALLIFAWGSSLLIDPRVRL